MITCTGFHEGLHLEAHEIYAATASCPVCFDDRPRRAVFKIQDEPLVEMLDCSACGASSASHMPLPQVLERYYATYYDGKEEKHVLAHPERLNRSLERKMEATSFAERVRLLDFGGGDGALGRSLGQCFLKRQLAEQVEVDVVDYVEGTLPAPAGLVLRNRSLNEIAGPYDVVLASAVLEHIPEVNSVLRNLFSLVGRGGYFYARTPFVLPVARVLRWMDVTYPAHVHDMGSRFWGGITETFRLSARLLICRPSPIEVGLTSEPWRYLAAAALKLPGRLEARVSAPNRRRRMWPFVGGWEALLRFT